MSFFDWMLATAMGTLFGIPIGIVIGCHFNKEDRAARESEQKERATYKVKGKF